jgi:hypothetical protein
LKGMAMSIENFQQLEALPDHDKVKRVSLDVLGELYYGATATAPTSVDTFAADLGRRLTEATDALDQSDAAAVVAAMTTEITSRYNGYPAEFATSFLYSSGRLAAEVFSEVSQVFEERYLDGNTQLYYDSVGNWYLSESGPQLWYDEPNSRYYDADGNSYYPTAAGVTTVPPETVAAGPEPAAAHTEAAAEGQVVLLDEADLQPLLAKTIERDILPQLIAQYGKDGLRQRVDELVPELTDALTAELTAVLDTLVVEADAAFQTVTTTQSAD